MGSVISSGGMDAHRSGSRHSPRASPPLLPLQGEPVYGAVTDNWPTIEPYFNETGGWLLTASAELWLLRE